MSASGIFINRLQSFPERVGLAGGKNILQLRGNMMGYFHSLVNYLKTDKGKHDCLDYIRAIVIMAAVMAGIRILIGTLLKM
jgi:hypothetical protein